MCGINFCLSRHAPSFPNSRTVELLKARGPDSHCSLTVSIRGSQEIDNYNQNHNFYLTFVATVLALRGDFVQQQPLVDEATGSILCWNGEAWTIAGEQVLGNDSRQVFDLLLLATKLLPSSVDAVLQVLTSIAGPFAFVFFDKLSSRIYYGRDRLGRRSLVFEQKSNDCLTVCSIGSNDLNAVTKEVSNDNIHCIEIQNDGLTSLTLAWPMLTPTRTINKSLPENLRVSTASSAAVSELIHRLEVSLRYRVLDIPVHSKVQSRPESSKIAILFSGGVDCTLLARIAHEILPRSECIDLLNVAFENPRVLNNIKNSIQSPYEICPDRITGRSTFAELSRICPHRHWRFIAVDIPYSELSIHRDRIVELMKPHNTEMDLSIAMALYFAARGQGQSSDTSNASNGSPFYQTSARILISGLGADELFGGYSRHSAAFNREGFRSLTDELELDFARIGHRNLGRDDRVVSHWGKEIRYPFLDESFVSFALSLPIWEKCGFRDNQKDSESTSLTEETNLDPAKILLRQALWKLGMRDVANEKKRAIQFGARTAKMEVGGSGGRKKKGTDLVFGEMSQGKT